MKPRSIGAVVTVLIAFLAAACGTSSTASPGTSHDTRTFLRQFTAVSQLASTVPANGDVNPYGIALVSSSAGRLVAGDTLVSNFNDKANVQGTGTTLVEVSPTGSMQLFAQIGALPAATTCPGGVGLTTALAILPGGWVVVGSLPTTTGGALPGLDPAGCLIVLNDQGDVTETITNKNIVGPWDLAATSSATSATLFVSNALGGNTSTDDGVPVAGNCTIVRVDLALSPTAPPQLTSTTVIGSNYPWRANSAALVLAPTGLALAANGTLYVDDSQTNTISAITQAQTRSSALSAKGSVISSGGALNAPLGMALAPDGNLLVVNGNNGNAVELSPSGKQLTTRVLVKNGAGDLFGLVPTQTGNGVLFVNDGSNALDLYH